MGYIGRDGASYNTFNEMKQANVRWEQQERLIREQKKQNELLEKQINKERQEKLYEEVKDWSGHDVLVCLKTIFYMLNIVFFIPFRIIENAYPIFNVIIIVFGIMVFFDIYRLIARYKNTDNNENSKK